MKICDICKESVDVLYPMMIWRRDRNGDVCPNCVHVLLEEKRGDSA
jgi:hypothetical protein